MTHAAPTTDTSLRYGLAGWLVSGGLAVTAAVTSAVTGPWSGAATAVNAAASTLLGLLVMGTFAPWPAVRSWRRRRRVLDELATRLRRVGEGGDPAELRELLEADEAATLGPLRGAALAMARDVASHRQTARRLHRNLGDDVRRETRRQTIRLQKEALTDPLTGLANRRVLEQTMRGLREQMSPSDASVVAMAIDLDHFKTVNDRLGHDAGDRCLVFIGQLLRSSLRREDVAVRLGGDEFIVIMPGQTLHTAQRTAERLAALFRQMPWRHRDVPRPSLSIGLAFAGPREIADGRQLLRAADEALYRAKRAGRNRIEAGAAEPVGG